MSVTDLELTTTDWITDKSQESARLYFFSVRIACVFCVL